MVADDLHPGADWWSVGGPGQVAFLAGVDPELLVVALDPLPEGAPVVIEFRPAVGRLTNLVEMVLGDVDRAAVGLFPAWLPGADRLDGTRGSGPEALRVLAEERAATSLNFGPFLVDLAIRSARGANAARPAFPAAIRAAGLARVVADAYGRRSAVLVVVVPDGLQPGDEYALVGACEWLAEYGRWAVWMVGAPLREVDRVPMRALVLPDSVVSLAVEQLPGGSGGEVAGPGDRVVVRYAPLAGVPRHDSLAELRLERARSVCDWAQGREWNRTFEWHLLAKPYRLDLFWPADGVIVEVDGPEHRGRVQYADDRRRDVQLQLLGHDVLRFTNEQVHSDVQAVTVRIEEMLRTRREARHHRSEKSQHA